MIKTIAIIGNPNCGKITLFNKLTGAKQKVGNWSGVTVDKKICNQTVRSSTKQQKTMTGAIDKVVTHRWLGIPIFLFLMYIMFELSMNIGTLLQPLFDISSTTLFINGTTYLCHIWVVPIGLIAILAQSIGLGINTVVNFIPQIGLMFLFLSLLEDSGYMDRAAFVVDRFMQFAGLPGKSFTSQDFYLWRGLKSSVTETLSGFSQIFSSTMINPFTANEADHNMSKSAMGNMVTVFSTPAAAFVYRLFVLLYIPCVCTIGVFTREVGKAWAWGSTLWSFFIAYSLAVIFYQLSRITLQPLHLLLWISSLFLTQIIIFTVLRSFANIERPSHV